MGQCSWAFCYRSVMKTIVILLAIAVTGGVFATPSATVQELTEKTIVVGGQTVVLNAAYGFSLVPPTVTDLSDYGDWTLDFVVSFDRRVEKGVVSLYGQLLPLFPSWLDFGEISELPSLEAGQEFRLLNLDEITYGAACEALERFNCGTRAPGLLGATVTVELRLYKPGEPANHVTLGRCQYRFPVPTRGDWFDANIDKYERWPGDAPILAFGGDWRAEVSLEKAAHLLPSGVLDIEPDSGLGFAADEARSVGPKTGPAVVETEVEFDLTEPAQLPTVSPNDKGGVVLVVEGGSTNYYGLAKVGSGNSWVKLEGRSVGELKPVVLQMTFAQGPNGQTVRYVIDGEAYSYCGRRDIPVVATTPLAEVAYAGCGVVWSLHASGCKPKEGFVLFVK